MSAKLPKKECLLPKQEPHIMQALKSGKTNLTIIKVIYGH